VRALLDQEKFKELDEFGSAARSSKARFAGGGWLLYTFYIGVAHPRDNTDEGWQALIARLQRWKAASPQSISASVALASAYVSWAWKARGTGVAETVSADAWPLFEERIHQAKAILIEAWELPEKCPEWFDVMQMVARAEGWDKNRANELLAKAIALEPEYYYNYEEHAQFLLPQWYGEEGEAARFAADISDKIGGKQGDIIYFRIAAALDCKCTKDTYLSHSSWPRIRRGYDTMEQLYGTHPLKLNQIAYMAVKAGDGDYANNIFTRIGDNWEQSIWQDRQYFEASRAWAARFALLTSAYIAVSNNMQTPEGQRYDAQTATTLASQYSTLLKDCLPPEQGPITFDALLQVSATGNVQQAVFWPPVLLEACSQPKLNAASLPAPPKPDYWIRITMHIQP
jgi:hypothetical protein